MRDALEAHKQAILTDLRTCVGDGAESTFVDLLEGAVALADAQLDEMIEEAIRQGEMMADTAVGMVAPVEVASAETMRQLLSPVGEILMRIEARLDYTDPRHATKARKPRTATKKPARKQPARKPTHRSTTRTRR